MHDHPRRVDAMTAAEVLSWEAVVSHQLKTPLCAMQAELARAREVDRSRILHDVQRLIRLIDQLHLAGLCRSRRIRMRPAPLAAAATQVCTRLAPLALDRGQTLALRRFGPDPLVMIDWALAEEAICNLVENAIKYAPEGSRVDVCVTDRGKVHVLDEGPGLTEADRVRVFEPFRRGAGAAGLPGSGLGLSLAAMIMSMHKGDVVQVNRPRGGSVFTLRFRKPKEAAVVHAPPAAPWRRRARRRKRGARREPRGSVGSARSLAAALAGAPGGPGPPGPRPSSRRGPRRRPRVGAWSLRRRSPSRLEATEPGGGSRRPCGSGIAGRRRRRPSGGAGSGTRRRAGGRRSAARSGCATREGRGGWRPRRPILSARRRAGCSTAPPRWVARG